MNSKMSFTTITKVVNIIFLIILQNYVLDSGMGIFGVSLLLYYVIYTILFGGIQTGISKMVSLRNNKGLNGNSSRIVKPAILYTALIGMIVFAFSISVLNSISLKIFGMSYPVPVVQILCMVLIVSGITDVLCGYHNGNGNVLICNAISLLKCIFPILFSFVVIRVFSGYGNKVSALLKNEVSKDAYAAIGIAAVYLLSTVLVFITAVFLTIKVRIQTKTEKSVRGIDSRRSVIGNFVSVSGKTMINSMFPVLSVFISVMFYINSVTKAVSSGTAGITVAAAYSNLGVILVKLLLPVLLVLFIFAEYVGKERYRLHIDYRKDETKIVTVRSQYLIKNTFFMLIPPMMVLIFLAGPIAKVMFEGQDVLTAKYLQNGGAVLLFAGLAYTLLNILKAVGKEKSSWIIQGGALIIQILFLFLTYAKGTTDSMMLIYSFYVNYLVVIMTAFAVMFKNIRLDLFDILMKIGKYGAAGLVIMILFMILEKFITMNIFLFLLSIFFGYLLYYLTLIALHGITKKDEAALKRTLNYYPVHFLRSRLRL